MMLTSTFCDFCNEGQQRGMRGYLEVADHEAAMEFYDWVEDKQKMIKCTECQNDEDDETLD